MVPLPTPSNDLLKAKKKYIFKGSSINYDERQIQLHVLYKTEKRVDCKEDFLLMTNIFCKLMDLKRWYFDSGDLCPSPC